MIKCDGKRYDPSQFVSGMLDSLQKDSRRCAPKYEHNSFVTMATYWVPDLPDVKVSAGHLWCSIVIFANGASSHDPASI